MAITFVGSNTTVGVRTDGGLISLSLPASVQDDLVVLVTGCSDNSAGFPSTPGYTFVVNEVAPIGGQRLCVLYKFMGATPDSYVSIPGTGSTTSHLGAMVLVFRGVNTATPMDVAVTTVSVASATVPDSPAITPARNDCCIVIAAVARVSDTSVGSVSNYLPSPSVQVSNPAPASFNISLAAGYRILSGGASTAENPLAWSTWTAAQNVSATLALRPLAASVDLITVTKATITYTGKAVPVRETTPVSKYRMIYSGKVITVPDGLIDSIFVDKYRVAYTGKTVNPFDVVRVDVILVTKASVLCRGRTVTPRDIQFEDIPRYAVRGRGSGTLSVSR